MPTTKTTIADTIYDAQLTGQTGTLTITPDSHWVTDEGETISPVPLTVTLSTGAFSVALIPTDALTSEGHYYTVVYSVGSRSVRRTATWVVPSGGPYTIEDVETAPAAGTTYNYQTWNQISTPTANPSSGSVKVYANTSGLAYLDSSGVEHDVIADDGSGNVALDSAGALCLGASGINGSWRFVRSGNNIVFERRESGVWVSKMTITA